MTAGHRWSWSLGNRPETPHRVQATYGTAGCGSAAGYKRHRRAGEVACPACRHANAAAAAARKATR
jgi:hypothetical protein